MTAFNSLGSSPSSRSLVPDAKQTSQKQVEIEEPSLNEPSQVLPDIQKSPPAPAVSISNIAQSVFLNYLPNVNVVAPEPVQDSPETSLTKEDVLFQDNPETNLLREDVLFQDNPETKGNKEDATVLYENTAAPSPEAAPTPEAPPLSPQDQQTNDRMRQLWDNINKAVPNASNKPQKLKNLLGTPIDFVYPITMFFGVRPQGGIVERKDMSIYNKNCLKLKL